VSEALATPFFVAAALLVLSGLAKGREPKELASLLAVLGLSRARAAARVVGIAEAVVGIAALVAPSVATAVGVAACYAAFSGVLAYILVGRIEVPSCGCIGSREAPPTGLHVVVTTLTAGMAVVAALSPPAPPWAVIDTVGPLAPVIMIGCLASGYAAYLLLALVPSTSPVREPVIEGKRG
jgi:drug/metabolite transporter (DMT)-like permease